MNNISKILRENDLIRTSCREEIIKVIMKSPTPLSEEEIKTKVSGKFDRTTFYRTFKTLNSKSVIHKIVIDNSIIKYALSDKVRHQKQHAHFYCQICSKVFCLPEVKWEYTGLPENYRTEQTELLIKGICTNCN
jgi:Fur family ferric uptake transcriptional regulator